MAADVEAEAVMLHRAADAADMDRVLLDHRDRVTELGELVGGGQPRRSRADNGDIDGLIVPHVSGIPKSWSGSFAAAMVTAALRGGRHRSRRPSSRSLSAFNLMNPAASRWS